MSRGVDRNLTKIKARDTALAFIFILLIIQYITSNSIYGTFAAVLTFIAMIWDRPFILLSKLWFGLSETLGSVMSPLVLSLYYYLFLAPLSIMFRISNKNPLGLSRTNESNFKEINKTYKPEDLTKIF